MQPVTDMVRPDCNQAKVNKCLIALINRKIVIKVARAVGVNIFLPKMIFMNELGHRALQMGWTSSVKI